jgi:gas vesicle protein
MRSGAFWTGVLIGAAIGAAIGMVYAPKAGEETREEVVEGVRKFREAASERGRRVLRRGRHGAEELAEESQG